MIAMSQVTQPKLVSCERNPINLEHLETFGNMCIWIEVKSTINIFVTPRFPMEGLRVQPSTLCQAIFRAVRTQGDFIARAQDEDHMTWSRPPNKTTRVLAQ